MQDTNKEEPEKKIKGEKKMVESTSKFCKNCNEQVLATREKPNHILHLLLSVVTCGWWLIIWFLISIRVGGYKCSRCGSKV